ncbi:LCP family protein [Candidatus Saccharibacteria bacterium]|nr:LCP family protein [Candidatus Saccharibacteria bacterium]
MSNEYDDFKPRRAASVDGFITGAGQRPRRPNYASPRFSASPRSLPTPQAAAFPPKTPTVPAPRVLQEPSIVRVDRPVSLPNQKPAVEIASELQDTLNPYSQGRNQSGKRGLFKKSTKQPRSQSSKKKRYLKMFGVVVLIGAALFGLQFYQNVANITGNNNPFSLLGLFHPTDLKNDEGRVNVLVAGNSADDLGHNGGELTDSIMVLSIDTRTNTAMMLSIPRDLWVSVPGEGHMKINAVYPLQNMEGLKNVVEDVTKLPIHYTTLINYTAFKDLVDAVGGITITIKSSDSRGIYDPNLDYTSRNCCALAKYPNGQVTLNGKQALNLARARGDGYGAYGFPQADYNRTENQRTMLLAIKEKASDPAVIANPFKVSNLFSAVAGNVKTDLQISEIQTLYYYAKKVDPTKIDSYNINSLKGPNTYMLAGQMIGGQSVQVPTAGVDDFSEIAMQIRRTFSATPVTKEAASVVVLNSTQYAGLARLQSNKIIGKGMDVLLQGNYDPEQPTTLIIDNSSGKKPASIAELKNMFTAKVVTDAAVTARYPNADIIVVLGNNAKPDPTKTSTSQVTSSPTNM